MIETYGRTGSATNVTIKQLATSVLGAEGANPQGYKNRYVGILSNLRTAISIGLWWGNAQCIRYLWNDSMRKRHYMVAAQNNLADMNLDFDDMGDDDGADAVAAAVAAVPV